MSKNKKKTSGGIPHEIPSEIPSEIPGEGVGVITAEPGSPESDAAEYAGTLFDPTDTSQDKFVRVSRWDPKGAKWDFQFRLAPEQATEELLQEYLGGGRFRCVVFKRSATGSFEFDKQRQITIGGAPKPLTRLPGEYRPGGPAPAAAQVMAESAPEEHFTFDKMMMASMMDMFRTSREQNQLTLEAVRTARGAPSEGDGTLAKVLETLAANQARSDAAQTKMFELMIEVIKKPGPPPPDTLALVKEVVGLVKPANTIKEQIDSLNSLYDLRDKINPVPDEGDPIVNIVRDNLPKVLATIEKLGGSASGPPVTTPKAPQLTVSTGGKTAPAPAPAAAPAASVTTPEGDAMWQQYVAKKLPILVAWAQRDKNPEVLASAEYELLPDTLRGPLRAFLTDPDAIAKMVALEPRLAAFTNAEGDGWLDRFLVQLGIEFGLIEEEEGEEVKLDATETGGAAPAAGPAGEAGPGPAA